LGIKTRELRTRELGPSQMRELGVNRNGQNLGVQLFELCNAVAQRSQLYYILCKEKKISNLMLLPVGQTKVKSSG